jgi:hypothetical protein
MTAKAEYAPVVEQRHSQLSAPCESDYRIDVPGTKRPLVDDAATGQRKLGLVFRYEVLQRL